MKIRLKHFKGNLSVNSDTLKFIIDRMHKHDKVETFLYEILNQVSKKTDEKYLSLNLISELTDIKLYKLKQVIQTIKRIAHNNNQALYNLKGVGYRLISFNEIDTETKTSFDRFLDINELEWKNLKDSFPFDFEFITKLQVSSENVNEFLKLIKKDVEPQLEKLFKYIDIILKQKEKELIPAPYILTEYLKQTSFEIN